MQSKGKNETMNPTFTSLGAPEPLIIKHVTSTKLIDDDEKKPWMVFQLHYRPRSKSDFAYFTVSLNLSS